MIVCILFDVVGIRKGFDGVIEGHYICEDL